MIVVDRLLELTVEDVTEPQALGETPDPIHDLGGVSVGVPLDVEVRIPVADHVENHAVPRREPVRHVAREVARAQQDIDVPTPITVVLAVQEQQVHGPGRRHPMHHLGQLQQNGGPRRAVVRAGHGQIDILLPEGPIGDRAGVPMRGQEQGSGLRRTKPGQEVVQG